LMAILNVRVKYLVATYSFHSFYSLGVQQAMREGLGPYTQAVRNRYVPMCPETCIIHRDSSPSAPSWAQAKYGRVGGGVRVLQCHWVIKTECLSKYSTSRDCINPVLYHYICDVFSNPYTWNVSITVEKTSTSVLRSRLNLCLYPVFQIVLHRSKSSIWPELAPCKQSNNLWTLSWTTTTRMS